MTSRTTNTAKAVARDDANRLIRFGFALLVALTLVLSVVSVAAQSYRFNTVRIEGNQRIGDASILQTAGIARGETVTGGQVNGALQRLQGSGLFETVSIEPQGSTLVITVVEYPTINRISYEGNRRIKNDALAALTQSQERRVYNPSVVERDSAAISEAYANEGRLAARVTPRVIRRSDNRVDLVFEIFEGSVVEIERLSFVGNRTYSDRRLRRVLGTKQAGLFRQFVRRDTLVEDRIEFDKQVLRDFYLSRGYVDFRTNSVNAELTRQRDGYFLVFNVQEGQQFKFGTVTVTSEMPEADEDVFLAAVKSRPGVVYSPVLVEADIARMERLAVKNGIDFLRVEPRVTRNDRDLTLDVDYVLSRGPRVFVERIDIEGNTTTLDRVVRRQFRVVEGDPFNPREIRESAERIRALAYFETAEVNAREGSSPDQVIVDVDVDEAPTGALTFGGTYSSSSGFGLAIRFSEANFLGRGQQLSVNVSTAEEQQNTGITFVEPALLGRDLQFSFQTSYTDNTSQFASYEFERLFIQPAISFPVSENGRFGLRLSAERLDMSEADDETPGGIIQSEIDEGETTSFSVGYTYTYDTRLTGLNPNAGVLLEFGQDFAGLGGDSKYVQTTAKVVGQTKIANEEVTLRATLEAGALHWQSGTNRAVDRFVLNPAIIRGFEPGGIGPRDIGSGADDSLGGNYFVAARFDAEFPLGLPEEYGITGGLFYDIGNLWNLDDVDTSAAGSNVVGESGSFRHVIGVSILWETPLGPLRFNFSNALQKETYDKEQSFDLTLSTQF
ncbi:outer membrane protein assembly factor BamA [Aliishimia ponticola]|uniref:Outer membrane protein assembly factor BamA n=1 Tax=Aliishimia ponticola TaxID=2499833 RepID=A0A4S4NJF5_9RHOB|nr:outer membrane protein assembly factor BamA [Aliishimia ponticola]THH38388.1 outer membrane protein assembly factor BamA [Aliishimia ponticola]